MERRSFLQGLLALFVATPELPPLPVPSPVAEVATAAAAAVGEGVACPFLLRATAVYISVEPIGFTSAGEAYQVKRSDLPLSMDEWNAAFAGVAPAAFVPMFRPRPPPPLPDEVWAARLRRRSRHRLSADEAHASAASLLRPSFAEAWA